MSHLKLIVGLLALIVTWLPSPAEAQVYDVLILGGTVIDGTGADGFRADVAVSDGRIALVSRNGIDPTLGETVIDAEGQVVTPGFIDNHSHVQQSIAEYPLAENFHNIVAEVFEHRRIRKSHGGGNAFFFGVALQLNNRCACAGRGHQITFEVDVLRFVCCREFKIFRA